MHFRGYRHHFRGCQEHERDHNVSHNVSREGVLDTLLRLSISPDLGPDVGCANHCGTRKPVTSKYALCTPAGIQEAHGRRARYTKGSITNVGSTYTWRHRVCHLPSVTSVASNATYIIYRRTILLHRSSQLNI